MANCIEYIYKNITKIKECMTVSLKKKKQSNTYRMIKLKCFFMLTISEHLRANDLALQNLPINLDGQPIL